MSRGPHPAHLKVELAVRGARLDSSVRQNPDLFPPGMHDYVRRTLDVVLPDGVWVSVPVDERTTEGSPFTLIANQRRSVLVRRDAAGEITAEVGVRPVHQPRFYARRTTRGLVMWRVGAVHGTHLAVSPGGSCGFGVRGLPCRFCLEGARAPSDPAATATVEDVLEVVRAAFDEGAAEFVYFNSGHYEAEDGGIAFLAPYIEAVRRHFDTLVATQVHPPRSERWVDRTYAMGVDALSYNLEIFDPELLKRHCVGRARYIGRERYLDALAHAAAIFPRGTVWSDLIAGLEPPASTIAGIDALTAMGVVPVIAILRAAGETSLPPDAIVPLLAHLHRAARDHHVNMKWMRDLATGITPLEARHFSGDGAPLAVAVQALTRWRLGAIAARGLARFRRRLRVRTVGQSFEAARP